MADSTNRQGSMTHFVNLAKTMVSILQIWTVFEYSTVHFPTQHILESGTLIPLQFWHLRGILFRLPELSTRLVQNFA
jgi:hypothetical protein